ncbi:YjjG family noncanonical pyrimidine nucleotidase [Alkalibacterium pelagium]|uniref:Putative hydrolase of the HAD superfamily n=1 Tax=Alkalibacterium pelagium TaxID=426702 RepID=A0A1H7M377_9LACT|nr:YjjG family noncanonical pyrimidine nucleotidase [Alkalibacterium pelagium]GEN51027.1 hypothetical protein APE02nite_16920 [Alkalibacterium pelagium]SEL05047.1 putative hydrolase of the HAD superfamily [Alkalibacterium pelagium]
MTHTLIFDLDDTILDFKKGEQSGLSKVFSAYSPDHIDYEEWLLTFKKVNSGIWKQIEDGGSSKDLLNTRFSETFKVFEFEADGQRLEQDYRSHLNENFHVLEGAKEMLERLKSQKYRLIAGTNGTAGTQWNRLKGTGLISIFDDVVISEEIGVAKPDKKFFDRLFEKNVEVDPQKTIMIGDSLRSDIQGARNAGLSNIWYNPSHLKNKSDIIPDFEVSSYKEMEKVIMEKTA